MSAISKIERTNASWKPVRRCDKTSPGCKHCYAKALAERWRDFPVITTAPVPSTKRRRELLESLRHA